MKLPPLRLILTAAALICSCPGCGKKSAEDSAALIDTAAASPAHPVAASPPPSVSSAHITAARELFNARATRSREAFRKVQDESRALFTELIDKSKAHLKNLPPRDSPAAANTLSSAATRDYIATLEKQIKALDGESRDFDVRIEKKRQEWEAKNWAGYPLDAPARKTEPPDTSPVAQSARADFLARREAFREVWHQGFQRLEQGAQKLAAEVRAGSVSSLRRGSGGASSPEARGDAGVTGPGADQDSVPGVLEKIKAQHSEARRFVDDFAAFEFETVQLQAEWEAKKWEGYVIQNTPPPR